MQWFSAENCPHGVVHQSRCQSVVQSIVQSKVQSISPESSFCNYPCQLLPSSYHGKLSKHVPSWASGGIFAINDIIIIEQNSIITVSMSGNYPWLTFHVTSCMLTTVCVCVDAQVLMHGWLHITPRPGDVVRWSFRHTYVEWSKGHKTDKGGHVDRIFTIEASNPAVMYVCTAHLHVHVVLTLLTIFFPLVRFLSFSLCFPPPYTHRWPISTFSTFPTPLPPIFPTRVKPLHI